MEIKLGSGCQEERGSGSPREPRIFGVVHEREQDGADGTGGEFAVTSCVGVSRAAG
jgi:hypothetical protein